MSANQFKLAKLRRKLARLVGSNFYLDRRHDARQSILVAGAARSGTTWLGELIAAQISCRVMFEPFHALYVKEYHGFNYSQYMRPGQPNQALADFAGRVLRGEIRNRWVDGQNETLLPEYRLIKEVRANLFLRWLHDHFPQTPILFIVRHPCAVVLSRLELGFGTDRDIGFLLSQPDLVSDFLDDHLNLIRGAACDEEKHAILWCVHNLVPLRQFAMQDQTAGTFRVVYYENLCTNLEPEMEQIFEAIGRQGGRRAVLADQPSATSRLGSAVVTGSDRILAWKNRLAPEQIERILAVVRLFGLDGLYGEGMTPQPGAPT